MILEAAKYAATSHVKIASAGMHLLRGEIRISILIHTFRRYYTIRDEQI